MGRLIDDVVDRVAIACGNGDAGRSGGFPCEGIQQVIVGGSRQGYTYLASKSMAFGASAWLVGAVSFLLWREDRRGKPMRVMALRDPAGTRRETVALLGHSQTHYPSCEVCDGQWKRDASGCDHGVGDKNRRKTITKQWLVLFVKSASIAEHWHFPECDQYEGKICGRRHSNCA